MDVTMVEHSRGHRPEETAGTVTEPAGRYVYCVAMGCEEAHLGNIGIEGREVYAVVYRDLCALLHDCPAEPYQAEEPTLLAAWLLAHHRVVEAAWHRWGTVLPLTFNTIIVRARAHSAAEHVHDWLRAEHASLKARLDALAGKAEYDLQLSWDAELAAAQVVAASPEVGRLREEIEPMPRGLAYMHRQRLDLLIRRELQARAAALFQEVYARVSRCAERVDLRKPGPGARGRPILMHVACLVAAERYPDLEGELHKVAQTAGVCVRLAGPLPPYSFC